MKKTLSDFMCTRCRVKRPVSGKKRCQRCIDQGISYKAAKVADAKVRGLCVKCFKEVGNGRFVCDPCNDRDKHNHKKTYNSRRGERLCVVCGGENNTQNLKCSSCASKINKSRKALADKRIKKGFCSRCFRVPVTCGKAMCPSCLAKKKIRRDNAKERSYADLAVRIKNNKNLNSNICGFIYKVVCETNDKIYIGQSVNFKARKSEHIRNALKCKSYTAFSSALRKHGEDKFKWELIHSCADKNELNYWERYYINKYDSLCGKNGYNILDGVVR